MASNTPTTPYTPAQSTQPSSSYTDLPPVQPKPPSLLQRTLNLAQKRFPLWLIVAALLFSFFVGLLAGTAGNAQKPAAATPPHATTVAVHKTTLKPTAKPAPTAAPKVWTAVQTFTGNGAEKTGSFSMSANDWRLAWTCDPNSSYGGTYNVIADVDDSSGNILNSDLSAINTMCSSSNTSGMTEEHNRTGTFYLDINSEGSWTFKVEILK
jgi:hypothetical protein